MKNLILIKDGIAIVQCDGSVYTDTVENFILDGGESLPDGVRDFEYKPSVEAIADGKINNSLKEYGDRVLASIHALCKSYENRGENARIEREEAERIQREQEEAERLANMTEEEKVAMELAQAKSERAEAVSKIIVEVDGMKFDGDEESQTRMGRTVAAAIALGVDLKTEKRTWVLADNSIAEVTIAQLAEALRLAGDAQTALWTVPYTG